MTPTLNGRLQTRVVMLATVGVVWVLAVGSLLPGAGDAAAVRRVGLVTLLVTAVVGCGWELVYHGLQQFRWDKDWPTLFGLVVGVPEGVVVHRVLAAGVLDVDVPDPMAFVWLFGTTWFVVWAIASGPVRVLFPRWRFNGGRFV